MKHATSRMLFAYWDKIRGERAAPERGELRPGDMRHVLADAFVLTREPAGDVSVRLAGTRITALFARELAGSEFTRLWSPDERGDAARIVEMVANDSVGAVAGLVGANENGSELALEMLLLPLRHRGRTASRLLGCLSPAAVPSWAGLVPLRTFRTSSLRIIEPGRSDVVRRTAREVGAGLPAIPRRRSLFVVHEGGRI